MNHRAAISFVLGILLAFQAACVIAVVDRSQSGGFIPGKSLKESYPFDPGGTISLENRSGNIEATGWDAEEVEVVATRGELSSATRGIRIASLRNSAPDVDIDKDGNSLRIRSGASRSGGNDRPEAVNFVLHVPHSVNLKDIVLTSGDVRVADLFGDVTVDLEEGDCRVENFSGSLLASVKLGDVKAEVLDLRSEDSIKITVKEGDITVYLQSDVRAKIEAETPSGEISSDFDFNEPLPAAKVSVELGERGASISLVALDGDIRILKTK